MSSSAAPRPPSEPALDRLAVQWRSASARHPGAFRGGVTALRMASWLALLGAVAGFALLGGPRQMLVALAWTLYLLWQFFVLARSKTLTWQACGVFFTLGALVVAPLAGLVTAIPAWVLNASPAVRWIDTGWTPIVEEVAKVLPLVAFAGSRRARTLSLADLGLAGAAVGAGFAFAEESLRRLAVFTDGTQALRLQPHWEVLSLLPGQAVDPATGRAFAGHAVLTAMVGLGAGLALRYRRDDADPLRVIPAALLLFAIADHIAFNAGTSLPGALASAHAALGAGKVAAPLVLALLACVTLVDLRDLNRLADLPRLPGEVHLDPVGELRLLAQVAPRGLPGIANLLAFLRNRRRMGFGLRLRREQRDPGLSALSARVAGHRRRLGDVLAAMATAVVLVTVLVAALPPSLGPRAAVAVFAIEAGRWWTRLAWYQQAAVAGTVATLAGIATGAWTAGAGVALVARDAADERADLTTFRADPGGTLRRWLRAATPSQLLAYGLARLVDAAVRRVPPDDPARRAARQWPDGWLPRKIDVYGVFMGRLVRGDGGRAVPVGFSHRGSIGAWRRARVVDGSVRPPDPRGVYLAVVELLHRPSGEWVRRQEPTTFFPDAWSRLHVLQEVHSAIETAVVEDGRWRGTSAGGMIIEGRVDPDGTVRTAHPRPLPRAIPPVTAAD